MQHDYEALLRVALDAARLAAAVHHKASRRSLSADAKLEPTDLVTEIDREAERQLVAIIRQARPHDGILGEEGTNIAGSSGVCWVIDPLDGTTNFVYGYPAHAVAVGVEIEGRRVLGVVHDTARERVYWGVVGTGAFCDGQPINATAQANLSLALVGTGFLANAAIRGTQAEVLRRVLPRVRDVRRSGCPALDLCAVAAGHLDAFYESGLGRWDISAGAAIAEAAGASVLTLRSSILPEPVLVVANQTLLEALILALREAGAVDET